MYSAVTTSRRFASLPLWAVLLTVVISSLAGCSYKKVSDYDAITDDSLTELHQFVETFFVKLELGKCGKSTCYSNNIPFYAGAKARLSVITARAGQLNKNDNTLKQLELIDDSLETLRGIHEGREKADKCMDITALGIRTARSGINQAFALILTFELAKKRDEEWKF